MTIRRACCRPASLTPTARRSISAMRSRCTESPDGRWVSGSAISVYLSLRERYRSTPQSNPCHYARMTKHVIAPVSELPPGSRKFVTIDDRPIAIFNIKGEYFGLLNRCPHQGAALCEGPLIGLAQSTDPGEIQYTRLGEILRCPWHGWEFDIRTGQSYCDPRRFRVKAYPVRMSNSQPC